MSRLSPVVLAAAFAMAVGGIAEAKHIPRAALSKMPSGFQPELSCSAVVPAPGHVPVLWLFNKGQIGVAGKVHVSIYGYVEIDFDLGAVYLEPNSQFRTGYELPTSIPATAHCYARPVK